MIESNIRVLLAIPRFILRGGKMNVIIKCCDFTGGFRKNLQLSKSLQAETRLKATSNDFNSGLEQIYTLASIFLAPLI